MQTEEQVQSIPEKRILSRIKSFASNKKSLKFSSPSRYHEEVSELAGNEGRVLNLIDLSKDYSRGHFMDS